MKRFLKYSFILVVIVAIGWYAYPRQGIILADTSRFTKIAWERIFPPKPCTQPITYSIGTFDTQFGISKTYFLNALTDAEAIWEKAAGKQLFTYDQAGGDLKINLIYDYRQQATTKLSSLGITVQNDQSSYDSLKAKYTTLKSQYATLKSQYDAQVADFDQKNTAYEQQVAYWNARGGAPKSEYSQLAAQRAALQTEQAQLQTLQAQVNNMVDEINALVVVLNQLANSLNIAVDSYNAIGQSRGESFEEGVYERNGSEQHIDIYEFSDRDKLVRVLAHELGHALGLEHVDDPKAIMYKLNQSANEVPTNADITELKSVCGIK